MTSTSTEWFQTFFSGSMLETLKYMSTPERTRAEADAIAAQLQLGPGSAALDVPCGNGRLAVELAARGHRVTGVDLTARFLEDARRLAAERHVEVALEHRDMRDLPWRDTFDGVFCFGNSFAYMDDAGNRAFLEAVRRALKPGGRFFLETGTILELLLAEFPSRTWHQMGDLFFLRNASYDPERATVTTEYTIVPKSGEVERKSAVYRMYTFRELKSLLLDAGFATAEGFASAAGAPFTFGSKGATYWVARRD